jgi:transposase
MLIPESQVRIWLYGRPTDMRKSFDGLSALVRTKLAEDPVSGQLFVFINRRRNQETFCIPFCIRGC